MPGSIRVKVLSARGLPVMDRSTLLTDAFVEVCIGAASYRTDVVRRSLNPSWTNDWFFFELDDRTLQEEALILKVMDHDTYSAHDTIGRVYFDLNPLLNRGRTCSLDGWFPIYDTMRGVRGELCLSIRVDVFFDASRYESSSIRVKFFHSKKIPSGYTVEFLIGFVQELVMSDDPEHQWIEKIRTSRASNEARQRLFSRLSGELQRKMGFKVLNLGGNSVVGYQLHFDLEGETGVVVRGIGTAMRLRKLATVRPNGSISIPLGGNIHHAMSDVSTECSGNCELVSMPEGEPPDMSTTSKGVLPQPLGFGEFPFLTISRLAPGMVRHFGGIVASKSVKLMDKNTPAGIQFRDAWWLELRTEVQQHMLSVHCNAVIGYREECAIYEDVCILSSYGTAVILHPTWVQLSTRGALCCMSGSSKPPETLTFADTVASNNIFPACDKPKTVSVDRPTVQSVSSTALGNAEMHESTCQSIDRRDMKGMQTTHRSDCSVCHLPRQLDCSPSRLPYFGVTSQRCAICKGASVPDLILSSSDLPPEIKTVGGPALIQAFSCRSKKDSKGEMAANELSEILPFIDFELHYWLTQKLRLRGMNAICGLQFRITIGEGYIASIASGTGVFIAALPNPKPPSICQPPMLGLSPEERLSRIRLQDQVNEFIDKSRCLFGLTCTRTSEESNDSVRDYSGTLTAVSFEQDLPHQSKIEPSASATESELIDFPSDIMLLEPRESEPEELALLLRDPLPPSGLLLATTETLPYSSADDIQVVSGVSDETPRLCPYFTSKNTTLSYAGSTNQWIPLHSFTRLHEDRLTVPDSVVENTGLSPVFPTASYPNPSWEKLQSNPEYHSNSREQSSAQDSSFGASKRTVSPTSTTSLMSLGSVLPSGSSTRNRSDQPMMTASPGHCLTDVMREVNQLTWFRFRTLIPCALTALDFRLILTEDDYVQVVTTGMVSVFLPATSHLSLAGSVSSTGSHLNSEAPEVTSPCSHYIGSFFKDSTTISDAQDKNSSESTSPVGSPFTILPGVKDMLCGCLLTPLSYLPNTVVDSYLGNLDFFFVRETNDLREAGGIRGFLHTALAEVQTVVGAHTSSLGGNALLSYHLSEVHIFRTASRNQAQCLFNVCGDMVRLSLAGSQ